MAHTSSTDSAARLSVGQSNSRCSSLLLSTKKCVILSLQTNQAINTGAPALDGTPPAASSGGAAAVARRPGTPDPQPPPPPHVPGSHKPLFPLDSRDVMVILLTFFTLILAAGGGIGGGEAGGGACGVGAVRAAS
jgi:hypothetical protein